MKDITTNIPEVPLTKNTLINKTGEWRIKKPIVIKDFCRKCKKCVDFCPDIAIFIGEDSAEIDYDYCKGCGICKNVCIYMAIEMREE